MRLIGIASLIRRIKERNPLLQESRRLLRAFDLLNTFVRKPVANKKRRLTVRDDTSGARPAKTAFTVSSETSKFSRISLLTNVSTFS